MAVTKIWPVRGALSDVLNYAADADKTAAPDLTGLQNLLDYAADAAKTTTEQQCFVSGIHCSTWTAREQMTMTKKRFGKEGGIVAYHAYQSFYPGEVTPEQCHAIGMELAQKVWPGHEVIVATHLNTDCCHNHFVINSVSLETGKRLGSRWEDYLRLRDTSDALCRQHGLSVVKEPERSKTPRNIYIAEKNGEPTTYNVMREDIDDAVAQARNFDHFAALLQRQGYAVRYGEGRKYATIAMPGGKPVRFKTLGDRYTEDAITDRIFEHAPHRSYRPPLSQAEHLNRRRFYRELCKTSGLLRLYLYYCWLLGALPKHTRHRPLHPALREDLRRFETVQAQLKLVEEHGLRDIAAVEEFLAARQEVLADLEQQRAACYKQLKHPKEAAAEELRQRRDALSEQIAALRREIKTAAGIPENIPLMEQNIRLEEEMQEQQTGRKLTLEEKAYE